MSTDQGIRWGKLQVLEICQQDPESLGYLPNGDYITLLLNGQQLRLRETDDPLDGGCMASFRIPVELRPNYGLVGYLATFRGYAASSERARVVFFADVAGESRTFQHAYDEAADGSFAWSIFSSGTSPEWDVDPVRIESPEGPVNAAGVLSISSKLFPLTINFAMFASRCDQDESAEAEITSVDIRALIDQRPDPGSAPESETVSA